jgi:hypothetical protein
MDIDLDRPAKQARLNIAVDMPLAIVGNFCGRKSPFRKAARMFSFFVAKYILRYIL